MNQNAINIYNKLSNVYGSLQNGEANTVNKIFLSLHGLSSITLSRGHSALICTDCDKYYLAAKKKACPPCAAMESLRYLPLSKNIHVWVN